MNAPAENWLVRLAGPEDRDALAELEVGAFGAASWGREAVLSGLTARGVTTHLVFSADIAAPVGFAMWRALGDEAEILTLGVQQEFRRQGAAAALLDDIIRHAGADEMSRIFLEVSEANEAAQRLYKRRGFRRVGSRKAYYRDGSDAIVMSAQIGA